MSRTIPIALYMNPDAPVRNTDEAFRFDPAPGFHLVVGDADPAVLSAYDAVSRHLAIAVYAHPAIARAVSGALDETVARAQNVAGRTVTGEGVVLSVDFVRDDQGVFDLREGTYDHDSIVFSPWVSDAAEFAGLADSTTANAVAISEWLSGLAAEISLDVVHHTQIALEGVTGAYVAPTSLCLYDLEMTLDTTFDEADRDQVHDHIRSACKDAEIDRSTVDEEIFEKVSPLIEDGEDPAP